MKYWHELNWKIWNMFSLINCRIGKAFTCSDFFLIKKWIERSGVVLSVYMFKTVTKVDWFQAWSYDHFLVSCPQRFQLKKRWRSWRSETLKPRWATLELATWSESSKDNRVKHPDRTLWKWFVLGDKSVFNVWFFNKKSFMTLSLSVLGIQQSWQEEPK